MATLAWALVGFWVAVFALIWLLSHWNHWLNPLAWVITVGIEVRDDDGEKERFYYLLLHWPRRPGGERAQT